MSESIGEALPKEMERVRALILEYRSPELCGAGNIAAALMENSLREADKAVISGDLCKMILAYQDLKGYE